MVLKRTLLTWRLLPALIVGAASFLSALSVSPLAALVDGLLGAISVFALVLLGGFTWRALEVERFDPSWWVWALGALLGAVGSAVVALDVGFGAPNHSMGVAILVFALYGAWASTALVVGEQVLRRVGLLAPERSPTK